MEWKIIFFVVILGLALAFVGLNLNNRSDISVGFYVWKEVPVFFTAFFSFTLGVLSMLPFLFRRRIQWRAGKRKERLANEKVKKEGAEGAPASDILGDQEPVKEDQKGSHRNRR
jgi:uncharacterized integral membrane protein